MRAIKPFWIAVAVLLCATLSSGCLVRSALYFARVGTVPMDGWEVRMDPNARRECLVVLLPGLFDMPDEFFSQGFVEEAVRASARCDLAIMDSNLGYYRTAVITDRLRADVLFTAEARGYTEIWIVGTSMGALGGILLAEAEPGRIRGIVMIAPWLGDEDVVGRAIDAGGLSLWTPPEINRVSPSLTDATAGALVWLRSYPSMPEATRPELYLAYGESDAWGHHSRLASEVVPEEHRITRDGQHDWPSWRALWRKVLEPPPWDRESTTRDPERVAPTLPH